MAAVTARPKLRILCFGDSLTAGWARYGAVHHPYDERMAELVRMAFPEFSVKIVEAGEPGDTVSHGFTRRLQRLYFPPGGSKRTQVHFDWVIVLGGTNDIGSNYQPEAIFEKLKEVWDIALRRGAKVLALTVPECNASERFRGDLEARRNKLNEMIKGHKKKNFHVFDLHAAVPYFAMSEEDREKYWDDGLHFTADGYDLIGNKVGTALVTILEQQRTLTEERAPKRKRLFKDDEKVFEEEIGDPTSIDQGYIVVRKTDLD